MLHETSKSKMSLDYRTYCSVMGICRHGQLEIAVRFEKLNSETARRAKNIYLRRRLNVLLTEPF